jgi:hypothetical protein
MFYNRDESELVALAGTGWTCINMNRRPRGQAVRFGWGSIKRFDVLKRFVVAETDGD